MHGSTHCDFFCGLVVVEIGGRKRRRARQVCVFFFCVCVCCSKDKDQQLDVALMRSAFLLWKLWIEKRLMKKQLLLQESELRAENEKLKSDVQLHESEIGRLKYSVQHSAARGSRAAGQKGASSAELMITYKLLTLMQTQLELDVQAAGAQPSPEMAKLAIGFASEDDHISLLEPLLEEMATLANQGNWEGRKLVYSKYVAAKAAAIDEEERNVTTMLEAPPDLILKLWVNFQLSRGSSPRLLNDMATDFRDSMIYSELFGLLSGDPIEMNPSLTLLTRATLVLDEFIRMGGVPLLTAEDMIEGRKTHAHTWMLCMLFLTRPAMTHPQRWLDMQRKVMRGRAQMWGLG
jgi:hypothetical protein